MKSSASIAALERFSLMHAAPLRATSTMAVLTGPSRTATSVYETESVDVGRERSEVHRRQRQAKVRCRGVPSDSQSDCGRHARRGSPPVRWAWAGRVLSGDVSQNHIVLSMQHVCSIRSKITSLTPVYSAPPSRTSRRPASAKAAS
ncbi:hypothetical protein BD310DRAFT_939958 [Dichomitus squalens]|uniref:Uncharacterized protein n=1 Tax=Dichomitus squalens TaxID=114155 RepID=A0A4Q9PHU1_9APHY|nr:hypothetical protein BD310DRAFT_939958 [Dichomitus squalens]